MPTLPYSTAELWLLIVLLALVTLLSRSFFLLLPRRWQPRGRVEQALRYAPLAALLAITVPEIVPRLAADAMAPARAIALVTEPKLLSALVVALVIGLTRQTLWGLVAGSAVYLGLLQLT
jgi:branched-subunit amino acid transport protein